MIPSCVLLLRRWSTALFMAAGAGVLLAAPYSAAEAAGKPTMKMCGEQWRAAKTAGSVPLGQTWLQFLKACRSGAASASGEGAAAGMPLAPDCGEQWKAAKAAGTVPASQTWPEFLAACRAAPSMATAADVTVSASKLPEAVAKPPSSAAGAVMKRCGERWRAAKASGTVVAGTNWRTYLAACRAELKTTSVSVAPGVDPAAAKPKVVASGENAPLTVTTIDIDPASSAEPPVRANVTAKSALDARRKTCSTEWKQVKSTAQAAGQTWPKFWSECNARLKTAVTKPAG